MAHRTPFVWLIRMTEASGLGPFSLPSTRCAFVGRIVEDDRQSGVWLTEQLKSSSDDVWWPVDPWRSLSFRKSTQ